MGAIKEVSEVRTFSLVCYFVFTLLSSLCFGWVVWRFWQMECDDERKKGEFLFVDWLVGFFAFFSLLFADLFFFCVKTRPPGCRFRHTILLRNLLAFIFILNLFDFIILSLFLVNTDRKNTGELQRCRMPKQRCRQRFWATSTTTSRCAQKSHATQRTRTTFRRIYFVACNFCHPIYHSLDASLHLSVNNMWGRISRGHIGGTSTQEFVFIFFISSSPPCFCGASFTLYGEKGSAMPSTRRPWS